MKPTTNKENKNIYYLCRKELNLTREQASELLDTITPERIERIENEKFLPHPDEVLIMSEKYKKPDLRNYYCSNECPIGKKYVPEIKIKDLSQIILEMIASLNSMQKQQERLVEITVDGIISEDEIEDFIKIQESLEQISITAETLKFWAEQMVANNRIDIETYNKIKQNRK